MKMNVEKIAELVGEMNDRTERHAMDAARGLVRNILLTKAEIARLQKAVLDDQATLRGLSWDEVSTTDVLDTDKPF